MNKILKYFIASYIFLFSIGCFIGGDMYPTHFDIRKMICNFNDHESYIHYPDGKKLHLFFTDSIYYFNAGNDFQRYGHLYANSSLYQPTEEIDRIFIIAHTYNADHHSGDTINHITNIDEILQKVAYQAQEHIAVSFKEAHTEPRHLTVKYFQTNGEHYSCEVKDEF